jgi:opacity protein-like surface antigen
MKRSPALVLVGLLALVAAFPAAAQQSHWLGVKGGWGEPSSSISTQVPQVGSPDSKGGVVIGLDWEGGLWKQWNLEAEVLYVERKASAVYDGGSDSFGRPQPDVTADYKFQSIEIPFHAKYNFSPGASSFYALGGWVTSIPVKIESVNTANGKTVTEDVKNQFDKAWIALEVGAGFGGKVSSTTTLEIEARYLYFLNDTAASSSDDWKQRDLRILAGLKFKL